MTARDLFDRVKLQLHRLNNLWSPTGQTFCDRTNILIDRAVWDDRNPRRSAKQLIEVDESLRARFHEWNDSVMDPRMDRWNDIYRSTRDMLDTLSAY